MKLNDKMNKNRDKKFQKKTPNPVLKKARTQAKRNPPVKSANKKSKRAPRALGKNDPTIKKTLDRAASFSSEISAALDWVPQGAEPVWPFPIPHHPQSFVSGDPESNRIRVRYYRERLFSGSEIPPFPRLLGRAWYGPDSEGPPGLAHGGSQASLLDEAMGGCAWMNQIPVVAARLTVQLRAPLPLGTRVVFVAEILKRDRRKVFAKAQILSEDRQVLYCEGEGLFVEIDPSTYLSALAVK